MAGRVGQQMGNYRLVALLGQGGFAEVYLGEHIYLETTAAIKVLYTQLDSDEGESFRKEARIIARLVHPHIVRVLDYGVEEGTPFLVVDYAPNGTLRKHYPKGVPLPLTSVVSYVAQIADALQYAHEQKTIHRDVKPENMLLGRHNEVLLSDFGIAIMAQSSRSESTQGMQDLAGTIAYMAPEQIQSQAIPASDQYSLAVVAYEWLTGTRPFQGSFAEIAVKHTLTPPPLLREKIPTLSLAVQEVIMKALSKDPKQRFPSVREFANTLEQAARKEVSPLPLPHEGTSPFIEAQPLPAASTETAVLAEPENEDTPASLATVPISISPSLSVPTPVLSNEPASLTVETPAPPSIETTALPQAGQTSSPQPVESSSAPGEVPLLPPKKVPVEQPVPRRISRRAVIAALAGIAAAGAVGGGIALLAHPQVSSETPPVQSGTQGGTVYTFYGHTDWVWAVAWSPKVDRIASASGDDTAQVWDAFSGQDLNIYSHHTDSVYSVSWSTDGTKIASASADKTVQTWDATYSDHFYTYTGHTSWVWTVAWSPDGKRIASAGGDGTVQVWDARDGLHAYKYTGHTGAVHAVVWSPDGTKIASAGNDGTVQVWDASSGAHIYTFQPYNVSLWAAAWSPDGSRIASAGSSGTVQVWDSTTGSHLFTYYGHADFVYSVAWSPDGKYIASASDDKTVQVWDSVYGRNPYIYTAHTNGVRSVSWSHDGRHIASASWDKTVRVWRPL